MICRLRFLVFIGLFAAAGASSNKPIMRRKQPQVSLMADSNAADKTKDTQQWLDVLKAATHQLEEGKTGSSPLTDDERAALSSAINKLQGLAGGSDSSECTNYAKKVTMHQEKVGMYQEKMSEHLCDSSAPVASTWTPTSEDCDDCFPPETYPNGTKGRTHLRSPCKMHPDDIPLPGFDRQKNANCPFLGTLTNEGVVPDDWMINETVWRAASFASSRNKDSMLPGLQGHFAGNFRDHSTWVDRKNKVKDAQEKLVDCKYWYLSPVNMEGMSNEHHSSVGISDCPTNWGDCAFQCGSAGEWKCQGFSDLAECQSKLPNADILDEFIQALSNKATTINDPDHYLDTCMLAKLRSTVDLQRAMGKPVDLNEDLHFHTPAVSFGVNCDHSFRDEDGTFLEQITSGTGGHIGGSIVGGYIDLFHFFGEVHDSDPELCDDGSTKFFKLQVKDLKRIDIERKIPCSFHRDEFFAWMNTHNGVTDRRKSANNWFDGCDDVHTEPEENTNNDTMQR
jgi:hypothetical protein